MQSQRLLLAKAAADAAVAKEIIAILKPMLSSRAKDDVDNDPSVVHAVWILNELGEFKANASVWNPILKQLLLHPASGARRNVLMAMPRTVESSQAIKDQGRVNDPNPHVRLQALITLAEIPGKAAGITDNHDGKPASWSDTAWAAAGIGEAATLPPIPPLEAVTTGLGNGSDDANAVLPRRGIRFKAVGHGLLELGVDASLPPGALRLFGLRGESLGRADFDGSKWSSPAVSNPRGGVLVYEYRVAGQKGSAPWTRGMIALRGKVAVGTDGL
jgi:hypothetical protein